MTRSAGDGVPATVCDECPRPRHGRRVGRLRRGLRTRSPGCLLEHGVLCCGPATPAGCQALCLASSAPCIGCRIEARDATVFEGTILASLDGRIGGEGSLLERLVEAGLRDPIGRFREYQQARLLLRRALDR